MQKRVGGCYVVVATKYPAYVSMQPGSADQPTDEFRLELDLDAFYRGELRNGNGALGIP